MSDTPKPQPAETCFDCGAPLRKGGSGSPRYWCAQRGVNADGWPLNAKLCPDCAAKERARLEAQPLPAWAKENA